MMRRILIGVLGVAVLANGVMLLDALTTGWWIPLAQAQDAVPQPGLVTDGSADSTAKGDEQGLHPADAGPMEAKAIYEKLIAELSEQKAALEKKAEEIIERERQLVVLQGELQAERKRIEALKASLSKQKQEWESLGKPNFDRLLKAYEGMDPDNAAGALAELYGKDRTVVVDLLLGLKSRQAALILDALAASHPAIAAELSLQIWKQDPRR